MSQVSEMIPATVSNVADMRVLPSFSMMKADGIRARKRPAPAPSPPPRMAVIAPLHLGAELDNLEALKEQNARSGNRAFR
jgi:hypothetical protein